MHHFTYNKNQRRKILNPDLILQQAGLKKGMIMVDLGCNDGYFSIPAASIVKETGKILGIDIDEIAVKRLKDTASENNLLNIYTFISSAEDFLPGENFVDLILLSTVLHDFSDPLKVLRNANKMLKTTGKLVNIDWIKQHSDFGPPFEKRFSSDKARNLLEQTGFSITLTDEINDLFYRQTTIKKIT